MEAHQDTSLVTITVLNARSVAGSRNLFALVDVEVSVAGVGFRIQGVQARSLPTGGTTIHLPTYKDQAGAWQPAIILPEETRAAVADAVLLFLVEEGLARRKFEVDVVEARPASATG